MPNEITTAPHPTFNWEAFFLGGSTYLSYIVVGVVLGAGLLCALLIAKKRKAKNKIAASAERKTGSSAPMAVQAEASRADWLVRLKRGLSKTRQQLWQNLEGLWGQGDKAELWNVLEETLYAADLGPKLVGELMDALKKEHLPDLAAMKSFLYDTLKARWAQLELPLTLNGPQVWMIVGVNGVGKTTTIGKLATKFKQQGLKVIVGAGDTFRAAAVDQLQVWCDRAGVPMLRAKEGAAPSGVAFDLAAKAKNEGADLAILDTAGRAHNQQNLMEELKKIKRVMGKFDPSAPQQVFLILDAISGQNVLPQAREFSKAVQATGIILTKCDGSSKAGAALAVAEELQVPIAFIGVGEGVEDLAPFKLEDFLKAFLDVV
jgi:fused signal recognition particle receptor